jgi:toxin-antitoxin system PIN domain toxin
MFLLDVNVLIALCDEAHECRPAARDWFVQHRATGWATCPMTENGIVRVMGHPAYGDGKTTSAVARELLRLLTDDPHHVFIPDDLSIRQNSLFPDLNGVTSKTLTDLYLVTLAGYHRMRLATFDARLAKQRNVSHNDLVLIPVSR